MICSLLKRELGYPFRFALSLLYRSVSRAMGCFVGCFRIRDDRRLPTTQLAADSYHAKPRETVTSQNRLSSLFLSKDDSPCNNGRNLDLESHGEDKELKDQAKFLKACGTLAGTPAEIRKASAKLKTSPHCGKDSDLSTFHSWLPNTIELQQGVQHFEAPTPTKVEELGNVTDSLEHTPRSCISNAHHIQGGSVDSTERSGTGTSHTAVSTNVKIENNAVSDTPRLLATDIQKRNKSVRFECDTDLSSCGSSPEYGGRHKNKTGSLGHQNANKSYPYPTPMKLYDEMQTPGTVYPATIEDLPNVKPRLLSQFVYSDYNPHKNVSQYKIHGEEDFNTKGDTRDSLEATQYVTSTPEKELKKTSDGNEALVEASLSAWLKPAAVIEEEKRRRMEAGTQIPKTPGDRPIIGMVAAHWNEDEESIPPKWWDGNGIPNSTNKYKEDQKVNWHATPFEERLEKALSEETSITQRKPICGNPVAFDEESDTAMSQLQSSPHPRSVVTC